MKKHVIVLTAVLGMAATATLFTGCSRPTAREAEINSKIASKVFELSEIAELTAEGQAVYVQGGEKTLNVAGTFEQTKLEGSKVQDLLKKVSIDANKNAINEHLKTGAIALVVLNDQIKIMKVVPEVNNTLGTQLTSKAFISKLKDLAKEINPQAQAQMVTELDAIQFQSPAQLNETFGLVEVTALKVEKHGVLDNEKTDYNEAKSILNVSEKPFAVSTHILVGDEVGAAKKTSDKAETEE
ncbi:hypothetical protein K2P97_05795 [bacterium]|nr:hypothetical protein [bacterium]